MIVAILVLISAASAPFTPAQKPSDIVHWSVKDPSAAVKPGAAAKVELTADIAEGWHLYALTQPDGGPPPLAIVLLKNPSLTLRKTDLAGPAPVVSNDPAFNLETQYYEGRAVFTVPLGISRQAKPGAAAASLEVTFQVCNNTICLRPHTETLTAGVTVAR